MVQGIGDTQGRPFLRGYINPNISAHPHFHIRWHEQKLDWECFDSREDAEESAAFLKHEGETFTIEEVNDECPIRAELVSTKSSGVGS